MGVHGLWKLIEPSGQMVPLESLAGKVLAIDVSIWLHQAVKGMHDASGAPVAVAHLLILFHRLCKLLFYKIKPVFVFDGGVPALKRQTMAARRQQSSVAKNEAMKVREKLIKNLLKHEAVRQVLSNETASAALGLNSFTLPGPSIEEDLYKLPPIAADCVDSESSDNVSSNEEEEDTHAQDIHSIDVTSKEFLSLPPEVRHDILTELIDTRKQSSWKYLDCMPKKSDSFSDFQMDRLLKRRAVQTSLEKAGQEMGGRSLSLRELESLLGDQGVLDARADIPGRRIAQDSVTHYMLVQKNSLVEEKETENKGEKFDIMNHLEEVDWSSESDTDVILKKSSGEELGKERLEEGKVEKKEKCEVKTEVRTLSKQPKIRMTEEIANLLSVLEDDNVSSDIKVKVEGLQNQIEPEEKLESKIILPEDIKTEEEKQEPLECQKIVDALDEEDKQEYPKFQKVVEELVKEETEEEKQGSECQKIVEDLVKEENEELPNVYSDKENEVVLEDDRENDTAKPQTDINTDQSINENKRTDSSSDSENDFVPIMSKESEIGSSNENMQPVKSPENVVKNDNGNPITITINPAEGNEKDDLFADLFEPGETQNSDLETEGKGVETVEDESNKEAVDAYRTEFEKDLKRGNISDLKKSLEDQQLDLIKEKGKQERHALNPTDQMYSDAQELLRLFGIPFLVAPMEAEAQCAALNLIGLTEGTITDDSDIWLFGGQVVYKNFFNQNKHVLEYRAEDIQKYFKLSREDMIKMALLVGSDYTVGLNGIGPVTALEILAAFRSPGQSLLDSLHKFRDWFTGISRSGPPRLALKKKIKNTIISPGFPSMAVADAYLHPQVDDSKEPFSWAKPNLDLIHKYTKLKMGWSQEKCDELLLPVLKRLEENMSQYTMEKYFKIVQKTSIPDGALSKRVENAIKRLGSDPGDTENFEENVDDPKPKRKRKPRTPDENEDAEQNDSKPRKKRKPRNATNTEETGDSEQTEDDSKPKRKPKPRKTAEETGECSKVSGKPQFDLTEIRKKMDPASKTRLINQKLHQEVKVPQKEMTQKLLEERKKQAIEIFRTFKKGGKKKTKVYAKEEVKLSESSSEDD